MEKSGSTKGRVDIFLACCFFFLGMYEEADEAAQKADETPLKNRVLFHVAHKLGDEKRLMTHHQKLQVGGQYGNVRLSERTGG